MNLLIQVIHVSKRIGHDNCVDLLTIPPARPAGSHMGFIWNVSIPFGWINMHLAENNRTVCWLMLKWSLLMNNTCSCTMKWFVICCICCYFRKVKVVGEWWINHSTCKQIQKNLSNHLSVSVVFLAMQNTFISGKKGFRTSTYLNNMQNSKSHPKWLLCLEYFLI